VTNTLADVLAHRSCDAVEALTAERDALKAEVERLVDAFNVAHNRAREANARACEHRRELDAALARAEEAESCAKESAEIMRRARERAEAAEKRVAELEAVADAQDQNLAEDETELVRLQERIAALEQALRRVRAYVVRHPSIDTRNGLDSIRDLRALDAVLENKQ